MSLKLILLTLFLGGLVSHQSPLFQEEFPSLAQEEKNKETVQPIRKEEDLKDTQYGPGPSLRPQSKFYFGVMYFKLQNNWLKRRKYSNCTNDTA